LPVESAQATSRQNDLRRMSNECAVDLVLIRERSTRTVTSGRARHSVRTRSKMSSGTSTGASLVMDQPPPDTAVNKLLLRRSVFVKRLTHEMTSRVKVFTGRVVSWRQTQYRSGDSAPVLWSSRVIR
jgi:hypothetical protein